MSTVNKGVNRSKDYLACLRIDQMHHVHSCFLQTNQNNECVFALVFFEIFYQLFFKDSFVSSLKGALKE